MAIVKKSGFDCEFVEKPPEVLQSECPVCLQILCEPYQVSCCGNSFCKVCIEKFKTDKKSCPTCKEEKFVTFHNKGLQISLYGFQVYCSHKQEGCEWKGELGQLDKHLYTPSESRPDKQLEGCEYSEIECVHCLKLFKNPDVIDHQNDLCPKRPFSCEYCLFYKSHYEDVIQNHLPVCGLYSIQCPNECGTSLLRKSLEHHVTKECPNKVTDCEFHHFGCDVRLPRKDMQAHLKADFINHMSLQAASYKVLQEKVCKLESENESLKNQLEEIEAKFEATQLESQEATTKVQEMQEKIAILQLSSKGDIRALRAIEKRCKIRTYNKNEFTMENFEENKRDGSAWFSPPFYSHSEGHKFCLRVHGNGRGPSEGTHVSVFIHLLKGEYDDDLDWPFKGKVTIQLLNQRGKSHSYLIQPEESSTWSSRVTEGERNDNGCGDLHFISHGKLRSGYLRNNCLHFCVTFKNHYITDNFILKTKNFFHVPPFDVPL